MAEPRSWQELAPALPDDHPDLPRQARRDRASLAQSLVAEVLAPYIRPGGIRSSPLGPGWSGDLDVHCRALPPAGLLRSQGWVCLDPLLDRLGSPGEDRWAICHGEQTLLGLDLTTRPAPDPVTAVLDRCRRQGAVRLREALELGALALAGLELPRDVVVTAAADVLHSWGGDALLKHRSGTPRSAPVPVRPSHRGWFAAFPARTVGRLRRRDVVVRVPHGASVEELFEQLCRVRLRTTVRQANAPVTARQLLRRGSLVLAVSSSNAGSPSTPVTAPALLRQLCAHGSDVSAQQAPQA